MTRAPLVIAALGTLGIGALAVADTGSHPGNHPAINKHQMIGQVIACMRKRMAADQKISYNEASRSCKEQVMRQIEGSVSGALVAADNPAKR